MPRWVGTAEDRLLKRFWSKVNIGSRNECWPWTAAIFSSQSVSGKYYGQFAIRWLLGFTSRTGLAHRVAWVLTYGPIPDGLDVLHKCDNPPCCNPHHFELGTMQDNIRQREERGRTATGNRSGRRLHPERWDMFGSKNPAAKLTEKAIPKICRLHKRGNTLQSIATKFGVTSPIIRKVVAGDLWKHVTR